MSTIRVNNVTDELGTGAPDFPNGITIDTVTVSGKIVHTGDTDTSIGFPINDTITMDTAGTERLRISPSGYVGIGTTAPIEPLDVRGAIFVGDVASGINYNGMILDYNTSTREARLAVGATSGGSSFFTFTTANGGVEGERMRIDSSGNVGIGVTPTVPLHVVNASTPRIYLGSDASKYSGLVYTAGTTFGSVAIRGQGNDIGTVLHVDRDNSQVRFDTSGTERMRIDSSGNLLVGLTSPTTGATNGSVSIRSNGINMFVGGGAIARESVAGLAFSGSDIVPFFNGATSDNGVDLGSSTLRWRDLNLSGALRSDVFTVTNIAGTERMRIDSSGNLLVGETADNDTSAGIRLNPVGLVSAVRDSNLPLLINRLTNDGTLVDFRQDNVVEGTISVSGTTVSYNGGHLSRWAQTTGPKDDTLVKGTVLSNLDEMNAYTDAEGNPVDNEQLNKVKVSDVEGDANVAGVFVNWTYDDQHNVDEINMAMTGDMVIRIGAGVTVARGDLLMSAGDGTAKPQGDDIVRSKTIAKVTSTHISHIYEDGSYCVPCVIMAC